MFGQFDLNSTGFVLLLAQGEIPSWWHVRRKVANYSSMKRIIFGVCNLFSRTFVQRTFWIHSGLYYLSSSVTILEPQLARPQQDRNHIALSSAGTDGFSGEYKLTCGHCCERCFYVIAYGTGSALRQNLGSIYLPAYARKLSLLP